MPSPSRATSRPFLFALFCFGPLGLVTAFAACTDNGESSHGTDFGPLPKNDGAVSSGDGTSPIGKNDGGGDGATLTDGNTPQGDSSIIEAAAPCTSGTIAILAGNDTSLSTAIRDKGAAWATQSITGAAAKDKPAIVPFGGAGSFLAVTHGPGDVLQSLTYATATWSAATTIGTSGVKGSPALAVVGGTAAHVVYSTGPGANTDYTHGINTGAGWNAATEAVGTTVNEHSFGTVSGGLAGAGTDLVFAENGSDNGLYVRKFDTAWSTSTPITGAGSVGTSVPATPELVAVDGTTFDLILLYAENNTRRISFATRNAQSKTWSSDNPPATNINADINTAEKMAVARTGPSTVIVSFRGQDGKGYFSRGTISATSVTWTAAIAIGGGAGAPTVDSTPAVAKGVCNEDAIFVYASSGSIVTTRLVTGSSWTPGETIPSVSGSRVAIATQ